MKKFGNVFYGRMKLEGESGRGGRVFSYKDPLNSNFIGGGGGRRRLYIVKRNNFLSFGGDTILCFPSTARHGLKVYQLLVYLSCIVSRILFYLWCLMDRNHSWSI